MSEPEKQSEDKKNQDKKEDKKEDKKDQLNDEKKDLMFRKLVVFGPTGPTGVQFVTRALNAGHIITAFARSEKKVYQELKKHDNLRVVQGDVTDQKAVEGAISGQDAVISCLGAHGTSLWNKTSLYSTSTKFILPAMKTHGLKRLVYMTSMGSQDAPNTPFLIKIAKPTVMAGFIQDMQVAENDIMKTDLDYTLVRPPMLTNDPAVGRTGAAEGQVVPDTNWRMSRGDVAQFMLDVLHKNEWIRKGVAIATKEK